MTASLAIVHSNRNYTFSFILCCKVISNILVTKVVWCLIVKKFYVVIINSLAFFGHHCFCFKHGQSWGQGKGQCQSAFKLTVSDDFYMVYFTSFKQQQLQVYLSKTTVCKILQITQNLMFLRQREDFLEPQSLN